MKQIKLMQLNAKEKDNALNEVRLLASIDSPNIISYKKAFFEEFGSTLCILMEYADGGDLAVSFILVRVSSNGRRTSVTSSLRTSSGKWPMISLLDSKFFMTVKLSIEISSQQTSFLLMELLNWEISMSPRCLKGSMLPHRLELLTTPVLKSGIILNMMVGLMFGLWAACSMSWPH